MKNVYLIITPVKNCFSIKMVPRFTCVFLTCEELVRILQTVKLNCAYVAAFSWAHDALDGRKVYAFTCQM